MNNLIVVIYRVFVLTLLIYCTASAQPMTAFQWDELVDKSHAERTVILGDYYKGQITQFDSSTVQGHIQRLKHLAKESDDPALFYEAECIKGHYFYYSMHIPNQRVLDSLFAILELAQREEVLWLMVRMESLIGHFNFNRLKEYENATIHLARAAELMNDKSSNEYPLKQVCNYHIGNALYDLNDFENALRYLRIASRTEAYKDMTDYQIDIINTIGVIYRESNNLDSSDYFFNKTLELALDQNLENWIALASGNLGENYFKRGNLGKAIPLLEKDAEISAKLKDWGVASNALALLGDIELQNGNIDEADSLLTKGLQFAHRSNRLFERLEVIFPRMAKLKASQGDERMSSQYIDSALLVTDSLERRERKLLAARSQQKIERERYLDRLSRLKLEKEKKVLERNLMVAIGLAILALSILLYNALWSKYMLKNKQLKKSEDELKLSRKRLIEITESLAERNKEIDKLKARPSSANTEGIKELQKKTILTEEDWIAFRDLFEETFPEFLENLQTKEAGSTQAEIRFLTLRKLDISPKKIAGVLGVGDSAIRQYRYRIRKKIGQKDLNDFIQSI